LKRSKKNRKKLRTNIISLENKIKHLESNLNDPKNRTEKDRFTPCAFGVALIIIGLSIFLLGIGNVGWIVEHGSVQSPPVIVLVVFLVLGAVFIVGGFSKNKSLFSNQTLKNVNSFQ
jgi:F0F1-type ATP synthase assembly protein I